MRQYMKKNVPSQQGLYLKKRIASTHARAKFVGIVYFFAILAIAAVACLPLFESALAPLGVMEFWRVFKMDNFKSLDTIEEIIVMCNACLYGLMLFGIAINVLKALSKLNWLFKKKGSRTYSFNRNVYAMEDLGNIFSGSFASIIIFHFIMYILCGEMKVLWPFYAVMGGGLFLHFFCGLIGGKASYFAADSKGNLVEEKRTIGRVAPFIRNVLQVAAVFSMMYFFLDTCCLSNVLGPILQENSFNNYVKDDILTYVSLVLQVLTALWLIVLVKHATGISEYSMQGSNASGMKNYRIFAFFVLLTAGATAVCRYIFGEACFVEFEGLTYMGIAKGIDYSSIYLAAIAFVIFVVEVIMRHMPHFPGNKWEEEEDGYWDMDYPPILYSNNPDGVPVPPTVARPDAKPQDEKAEVKCPTCGKLLKISAAVKYHRCPCCGKVFETPIDEQEEELA